MSFTAITAAIVIGAALLALILAILIGPRWRAVLVAFGLAAPIAGTLAYTVAESLISDRYDLDSAYYASVAAAVLIVIVTGFILARFRERPAIIVASTTILFVALSIPPALYFAFGLHAKAPAPSPASEEMPRRFPSERESELGKAVNACREKETCVAVDVLFGTNRKIWPIPPANYTDMFQRRSESPFSEELADLQYGRLEVNVPVERDRFATLPRPKRIDALLWSFGETVDPEKHFALIDYGLWSEEEFRKGLSDAPAAFVFIHGFNTSLESAAFRAAQIKLDTNFEGQPIIFSWPTKTMPEYSASRKAAEASRAALKEFLSVIRAATGAKEVHIVAHSMGNHVLLDVLAEMEAEAEARCDLPASQESFCGTQGSALFNELILAAPDVGVEEFKKIANSLSHAASGRTLYASSNDLAMKASLAVCTIKGEYCSPRIGDAPDGVPPVVEGVETIDVSRLGSGVFFDLDFVGFGHEYYGGDRAVLGDMSFLFHGGVHPPDARNPSFDVVDGENGGIYWRYK